MSDANAGIGTRFVARLLDAVIIGLPASLVLAVAGLPAPTIGLGGTEVWMRSAVTGLLWFTYYVAFESRTGWTVGKRLLGIRVAETGGDAPGIAASATRNSWILLGLVPWVGGIAMLAAVIAIAVTISSGEDTRGLHDRLAGTFVTR